MKRSLFFCSFFLVLVSCGDQEIKEEEMTNFNKINWMLGIWEGRQGDADIYESWRKKNFRIMEGISYTTQEGSRVYAQTMRIEQNNNKIFLIVKLNQGEENILEAKDIEESKIVFENNEEGFPQKITYEKSGNSMSVFIEGNDSTNVSTTLNYKRTGDT